MKNLHKGSFILLFIATGAVAHERTIEGAIAAREAPNPFPKTGTKTKDAIERTTTNANSKFSTEPIH